jgi:hypothetical protein
LAEDEFGLKRPRLQFFDGRVESLDVTDLQKSALTIGQID